jgi:phage shock protein A
MQKLIVWLMGDNLGTWLINTWDWLIQAPTDPSSTEVKTTDEINLKHATQLLELTRSKVMEIQNVVERVRKIATAIQLQYDLKCNYHQNLMADVLEFKRKGNILEARLSMAKVVEIERVLPELKAKLENSQEMLIGINKIYAQKESELFSLQVDLESMKAYMAMHDSTHGSGDRDRSPDLIQIQEKFRHVLAETEDRYREIQIVSQLANPSNCELGETLNLQDIDNRIEKLGK